MLQCNKANISGLWMIFHTPQLLNNKDKDKNIDIDKEKDKDNEDV